MSGVPEALGTHWVRSSLRVAVRASRGGAESDGASAADDGTDMVGAAMVAVGTAIVAVGSTLTWHRYTGTVVRASQPVRVSGSVGGLDTDGTITAVVAVLGGAMAILLWDRGGPAVAGLAAVGSGGLAGYHLLRPVAAVDLPEDGLLDVSAVLSPGLGLYVVVFGAGVTLAGALIGAARS